MDWPAEEFYTLWEKWFAWCPVKVEGVRVWGESIYRRKPEHFVLYDVCTQRFWISTGNTWQRLTE